MAETYRERAERGAALLDRLMPTWYRAIDLDTLKLADCQNCVCGQIAHKAGTSSLRKTRRFRSWIDWTLTLEWFARRLKLDYFQDHFEHGFSANTAYGYHLLDKEWGRIVRERLEKEEGRS